jgi:putative ubiquitin-RnfH superfamily antitoxin RatB of RatAB toxin-antitoxin module
MKKNFYLIIVLTFCVFFVQANTQSVLWSETFEGDWTANWHADAGTWEVGIPTSGPNSAFTGDKCAATVLGGNYSEPVATRLIRHTSFVVPAASENPRLRFWYWFSFSNSDWGQVQIKVNDGAWESISIRMNNYGSNAWSYGSVDISAYAGLTVQIAFNFHSENYLGGANDVSSGWYIDDVSLVTGPYVLNTLEDFESGFGDWSVDEGSWEVGIPASGPSNAHSGQNCVGTNLNGNYQEPADSRLVSPPFVVPAASENPRIRFWYWMSFSASDNGQVQIKTSDGGWESISIIMNNYGSKAWSYGSVDISAYSGSTVQIAFNFHSENYLGGAIDVSSGWYIDDVSLVTGPYVLNTPEDFESGFGDWSVDEGSWEVGIPASGPSKAHSGQNCVGTNLNGNYQEPADSRLVSPPFVVPAASENPGVQFWQWFSFGAADYGEVQIRINNNSWQPISSHIVNTSSGVWTPFYISLSAYAGSTVQIAFDFHSENYLGGSNDVSTGWYIDDIKIDFNSSLSSETDILTFSFGVPPQTGNASIDATIHTIDIEVEYGTVLTNLISTFTLSDGASTKVEDVVQESGVTANNFSSPVTYTVTAEDGTTVQDWVVTVTVAPNTKTEILEFGFGMPPQTGAASTDVTNRTIDIEVEYGTDLTSLVAEFTLSEGATSKVGDVVQESGVTANDFTSPVTYTVTAEDGTTIQDWIVTVTVAPNTETDILTYSFGIPPQTGAASIDEVNHTVDVEVESGTDLTALVATFTLSEGAKAEVGDVAQTSGTTSNDFTNPVTYTITAEDGTTKQDWIVTVTEAAVLSNETDILTFSFGIPPQTGAASIDEVNHTIDIEVEAGTDLTNLVSTFTLSDGATAEVGGVAQTSGTTSNNFSSPVTYIITAGDGTTEQDWIVTVTEAAVLSNETDILTYSFGIPPQTGAASIDEVNHTVDIEVESGTDLTNLVSTFTLSNGATAEVGGVAQTSGTTSNDFSSPVTYTITAENGTSTQDWVIAVTEAPALSNETNILNFSFGIPPQTGAASINAVNHTVDIEVESGTDLTAMIATFTLSSGATAGVGGVAQISETTSNDFSSPVTYTITAEDGTTTQDWLVTVTEAPALSDETNILTFSFGIPPQTGAASINAVNHTVVIEVESGTDLTSLVATFTLSSGATAEVGGVAQTSGTTSNDLSSPLTYLITAENGTTEQEWVVTVNEEVVLNSETDILTYSFGIPPQTGNATINFNFNSITIEVEYGTDLTNLIATYALSEGASAKVGDVVQESGVTANDFTNPLTITVTAEDGTTVQNWVVTVLVAPNTETEILEFSFGIPPQTGVASINSTARAIEIEVEYGTDLTDLVAEFLLSDGANVSIGDVVQESGVTTNDFTNPVTYKVTAEDGTTVQDWVVTVSVVPNTETEILEFGFGVPPQTGAAVINPDTRNITIEVESETDLTNLIATFTLSEGATAKIGDTMQESGVTSNDFSSPVVYKITAEDDIMSQEWTITVDRVTNINDISGKNFKIYPNPFSDYATVEFNNPNNKNHHLILYNILGEKVFEMNKITSEKVIIKRGSLVSGIYLLELKGEQNFNNQLIIVK